MKTLETVNAAVERDFLEVWENGDRQAAFELCNRIREETNVPLYTHRTFNEGYAYRTIFVDDYEYAKDEFVRLVFGWW